MGLLFINASEGVPPAEARNAIVVKPVDEFRFMCQVTSGTEFQFFGDVTARSRRDRCDHDSASTGSEAVVLGIVHISLNLFTK